jgi:hypothetical protein
LPFICEGTSTLLAFPRQAKRAPAEADALD